MTRVKGGALKMQWQDQSNPVCTPGSPWGTTCGQVLASGCLYHPQRVSKTTMIHNQRSTARQRFISTGVTARRGFVDILKKDTAGHHSGKTTSFQQNTF